IYTLMIIHFVLVEPLYPENIGAAARAIKTMGFNSLRLVNPCNHLAEPARWLAHGSIELLEEAGVFNTFDQAVEDIDFIIGTTSKIRTIKQDYYPANKIYSLIQDKKESIKNLALVFGGEESGLSNKILKKCHIASSIPMKSKYPSLNLAQSVMVYAYSVSGLDNTIPESTDNINQILSYKELRSKTKEILNKIDIKSSTNIHSRIMERMAILGQDDINLLHSICNELNRKI
ncbi:tRNA/rRNA methyltransferase, partial [Bacteroidota bacterium]